MSILSILSANSWEVSGHRIAPCHPCEPLTISQAQEEGIWKEFLDASSHLYMRVSPFVGPSIRRSVRRFFRNAFFSRIRETRDFDL